MNPESIFLAALNAYHRIYPDSFFRRTLEKKDLELAKNSLVFIGFSKLISFAKENKDYFVIFRLIEHNVEDVCDMIYTNDFEKLHEKFDKIKKETDNDLLAKFDEYFSEEEKKI